MHSVRTLRFPVWAAWNTIIRSIPLKHSQPLSLGQCCFSTTSPAQQQNADDGANEFEYIDEWQITQIKPEDFYEENSKKRNYFYWVDLHGRLYLENTVPKNIATSLKV